MPETIQLTAADGHQLDAYRADPEGTPHGAIVVIQEIFGVNVHIRDLVERWAAVGYTAIAPALYDRLEKGFETGYEPEDIQKGRELKDKANAELDKVMADVEAAVKAVESAGRVGITGFCWGGFVAYAAACRLPVQAASGYYGGGIHTIADEAPNCPTILHYGEQDQGIPLSDVETVRKARPEVGIHLYDAGHGFHCDRRGSYDPRASAIAGMRTVQLFESVIRRGESA